MKLNNISVSKYIVSKDKMTYDNMLMALKPENIFSGKSFNLDTMSYIDIRRVESLMKNGKSFTDLQKAFSLFFGTSEEDFYKAKVLDFFRARNFMKEKMIDILDNESRLLQSVDMNAELWEMAGGDKLKPLSNLMPLMHLGKMYNIYPFDLETKPYKEILFLLYGNKVLEEVTSNYNKLKNPKK